MNMTRASRRASSFANAACCLLSFGPVGKYDASCTAKAAACSICTATLWAWVIACDIASTSSSCAAWGKYVKLNTDPYGKDCVDFARRWADLMEAEMATGAQLEKVAKSTCHKADTEGITGFMYGAAVSMLARCWEHGEALRLWHNLKTQIKDEGKRANAKPGAVLNPALLNIRLKSE